MKHLTTVAALAATLLVTPLIAAGATHAERKSELAGQRRPPYSSAVLVGGTLYIAGTTGDDRAMKTPVTATEEARSVMNQIKHIVRQYGMTMDDIVSIQVFCSNLADYGAFNSVYRTYFHSNYPARAFIGVSKLLGGARYEVMGIAVRRN